RQGGSHATQRWMSWSLSERPTPLVRFGRRTDVAPALGAPRLQQLVLAREQLGQRLECFDPIRPAFFHDQLKARTVGVEPGLAHQRLGALAEEVDHALPLSATAHALPMSLALRAVGPRRGGSW